MELAGGAAAPQVSQPDSTLSDLPLFHLPIHQQEQHVEFSTPLFCCGSDQSRFGSTRAKDCH